MKTSDDPTDLDAHALSSAIHCREVSCREVMQASLARIHRLNPRLNAIVNLLPDETLLRAADERDAELAQGRAAGGSRGFLHGMPLAIKDTAHVAGLPTTLGSPLLQAAVATHDSAHVERMKAAGCIVIGKTNVPELAIGSNTYNALFGSTGNAWDPRVTAGGSSGGAAVALAHRLVALADGSDFMGSLRNPAGWNHVFGMRPSQGRVPAWPKPDLYLSQLSTDGPLARNVRDLAALLQIQSGHDPRAPLSLAEKSPPLMPADDAADHGLRGVRIGWLGDLAGHLAVEPGILEGCEAALSGCAAGGACVEPATLGFSCEALWQAWLVWRRALVAPGVAALLLQPGAREHIKPEALWEHDSAAGTGVADLMQASVVRSSYHQHLLGLFERFDVLALPVAQCWPFAIAQTWPRQIAGRAMDTYHRWMECTLYATFGGLPALSVPAGFDAAGRLPLGLQLIGRPQGDAALLRVAAGYEATCGAWLARRPAEPG